MKSLLVDALRQIESDQDGGSAGNPEQEEKTERSPQAGSAEASLDTGELTLALDEALDATLAGYETHPLALSQTVEVASRSVVDDASPDSRFEAHAESPETRGRARSGLGRAAAATPLASGLVCGLTAAAYLSFAAIGQKGEYVDPATLAIDRESVAGVSAAFPTAFDLKIGTLPPVGEAARAERPPAPPQPVFATTAATADPAYPLLADAYLAWESGNVQDAIARYEAALAVAPRHPSALRGLGALLVHTGRDAEAREVYTRLLSVDPGDATAAAVLLADADGAARGDTARALLTRFGNSAPLHAALGSALADERRWADARVAFAEAVRLAPDRADYAYNLAVVLDRLARYGDARGYYRRALELGGDTGFGGEAAVVTRLDELAMLAEANPR